MKKLGLLTLSGVLALMMGCEGSAIAQGDALDRTSLPIQPPVSEPVTELDARNVTPPPKGSVAPKPMSSINTMTTLGAPSGGVILNGGGAIETPTFSQLAENGLRFNQFHTTALCSPTRASLLAGRNHHRVNVGSVMELSLIHI